MINVLRILLLCCGMMKHAVLFLMWTILFFFSVCWKIKIVIVNIWTDEYGRWRNLTVKCESLLSFLVCIMICIYSLVWIMCSYKCLCEKIFLAIFTHTCCTHMQTLRRAHKYTCTLGYPRTLSFKVSRLKHCRTSRRLASTMYKILSRSLV